MTQHKIAKRDDLRHNQMKVVKAGDTDILLYRIGDDFYATSAICPHYGAPLEEGVVSDKRVICPWHHSAFDIDSGDLIEPPSRDGLERYRVEVDGDDVIVHLPKKTSDRKVPAMTSHNPDEDDRTFVIVGGGAAGNAAAQALREFNFKGRVIIVTPEKKLPYDRPNLSKDYLQGQAPDEWIPLR
ncbi:Rieske 2Fe-2S domain-containing protein, partial [candidate division GN15 bacterium]|nr:Rieske 2Fe-2S domain-containing protein [candidate division GN15 bacterium]